MKNSLPSSNRHDDKNNGQGEKNTHTCAYSDLFKQANHHYAEADAAYGLARDHDKNSLQQAKLAGEYLNRAKVEVKERGEKWLPVLAKEFKGGPRNGQNFMEIARRWKEIEFALTRNPDLSVSGALKVLRGRDPEKKPNLNETLRAELMRGVQAILKKATEDWPLKDIEYLGTALRGFDFDLQERFRTMIEKLRAEARQQIQTAGRKSGKEEAHHTT